MLILVSGLVQCWFQVYALFLLFCMFPPSVLLLRPHHLTLKPLALYTTSSVLLQMKNLPEMQINPLKSHLIVIPFYKSKGQNVLC